MRRKSTRKAYPTIQVKDWRKSAPREGVENWKLKLVQIALYAFAAGLILRLLQIQIFDHELYARMADNQYLSEIVLKAKRGIIYDRNMEELALNKPCYDIGLDLYLFPPSAVNIRGLARVLGVREASLTRKIRKSRGYLQLKRGVDKGLADQVKNLRLPGTVVYETSSRIYPFNETLAQVLGFVNIDSNGLSGVELTYNDYLKGQDGWTILQKDATGRSVMPIESATRAPVPGADVILTIDYLLQTIAEEELTAAIEKYHAKGGSVVVVNPKTGEVLALASAPTFDANHAAKYPPETWRIRPITDIYEPGSTFKIVTMTAALSEGMDKDKDIFFCENGVYKLYGHRINDAEKHGWLSFNNIFKYSSNIGAAKIAQKIGKKALFIAARDFGMGNRTGIGLVGEVPGILKKPSDWSAFSLAAISYGYEVAVTPLQIAMAYSAVANGGLLMQPYVVKQIVTQDQRLLEESKPQVIRQVMDPQVANDITSILEKVVEEGTGQNAQIPGYQVAGKTGTAKKTQDGASGYSNSKFVASFVGFYPTDKPELVIVVMIDEPFPVHSGGSVAAPTFRKILERTMKVYDRPPVHYTERAIPEYQANGEKHVPDLKGRKVQTAIQVLKELHIDFTLEGAGDVIVQQNSDAANGQGRPKVRLTRGTYMNESGFVDMPHLVGMPIRQAVTELAIRNLDVKIIGSGDVIRQDPSAGAKIKSGARCLLECQPTSELKIANNLDLK